MREVCVRCPSSIPSNQYSNPRQRNLCPRLFPTSLPHPNLAFLFNSGLGLGLFFEASSGLEHRTTLPHPWLDACPIPGCRGVAGVSAPHFLRLRVCVCVCVYVPSTATRVFVTLLGSSKGTQLTNKSHRK